MYINKKSDSIMEWNSIITVDNYEIPINWRYFRFTTKTWYYDDNDFNDTIYNIINTVISDYKRRGSSVLDYSWYNLSDIKEYLLSGKWKEKEIERIEWMIRILVREKYDLESLLDDIKPEE